MTSTPALSWRERLAAKLGRRYAVVVDVAERAATAALIAFGAKAVAGDLFEIHHVLVLSYWEACGLAAAAGALSVLKSSAMQLVTGDTALGSLVSRTLRARRELPRPRPRHRVPLRKPRSL